MPPHEADAGPKTDAVPDSQRPDTVREERTTARHAGSWWIYYGTRTAVHAFLLLWHRIRVRGRRAVPRTGPLLIVANHASFLDIPAVAASIPRRVTFVARESLRRSRFLSWLIDGCGAISIRQGEGDRAALRAITERLQAGGCVAIFPEGSRTEDGRVGAFQGGATFAARRTRATLLPVAISGTFEAFPRSGRFPRPHAIRIQVLPVVDGTEPEALERARTAIVAALGQESSELAAASETRAPAEPHDPSEHRV